MRIEEILQKQGEIYKNLHSNKTIQNYNEIIKPNKVLYRNYWISNQECEAIKELEKLLNKNVALVTKGTRFFDFEIIIENSQIISLRLINQKLKKIPKSINNLPNLKELWLCLNRITEIKNLDNLPNLLGLYLFKSQIQEIKNLDNLTNLKILYLYENEIKEIDGLHNLINLRHLDLGDNEITEIKNLDKLTNLQTLWLKKNQITEIENLPENLKELNLSYNKIKKIKNMEGLQNLCIELTGNKISKRQRKKLRKKCKTLIYGKNDAPCV